MDINDLFRPRLGEEAVELAGVGTVRVRGLSRAEMLLATKDESKDTAAMERTMLSMAMVDPPMSEAEVGRWQAASPANEMKPVVDMVNQLSGTRRGADKSSV